MSRTPNPLRLAAALLITIFVTACAPATNADADSPLPAPASAQVYVVHNVPVALSLTVTLIEPTGTRVRLGNVAPGRREQLTLPRDASAGEYRLVAQTPDGRTVTSEPFAFRGFGVEWDVEANRVRPLLEP